jgi:hypothetical protein
MFISARDPWLGLGSLMPNQKYALAALFALGLMFTVFAPQTVSADPGNPPTEPTDGSNQTAPPPQSENSTANAPATAKTDPVSMIWNAVTDSLGAVCNKISTACLSIVCFYNGDSYALPVYPGNGRTIGVGVSLNKAGNNYSGFEGVYYDPSGCY